jgi:transcriptional regulator with XRE-family HTH domain
MPSPNSSDFRKRVGLRIRSARERKGLSQTQLAHQLGVSNTQVSRWETGRGLPLGHLDELSEALGMSPEQIFGGGGRRRKD